MVGGHHGTPPDKSKIDEEKNRETNVGLDSEAWVSTQDELIDFVANIAGIEEKEWEDLSERRFSVQSAVLMTGLVIMADWIASNSDEDMFPLVRTEPWADEDEDFFFSESGEEDDIQSWSGLRIRADRAWSCVQLPHAWVPEGIPSSCQDLFATRFTLPEGAKVRPVQEEAVRIARDTRQPGLMVIEAPMGEGKTEAALAAAEIMAQRTGRGGVCVALPTMATTDAMFTRVHRWLEALPSCDFDNEKTVWLAHGKAQLNNDFRGIIAASHRRFSSVDQDDVKQESSQNRKKKQIDVPPETVVSDWLWGRKKGALANFLVCTVDQVLMSALQMKHVVLRQLAMANKVVIIDECHAYDAYMQEYLKMALEWLGGYRTPVILLSATLPECQRNAMVEAYLKGWCDTEPRKASKVIFDLQREYTAESGSNARSRARVARLRRDLDGTAPTWMSIGEELFAQWPQELEAPADDSPEFDRQVNAVKVALELYAVHQQSKGQGVAQKYQTDPSSRMTFGRACRRITPDPEQVKGVLRRLRVVESASDFNGVVRGVRTLIMLMRGADVQIDYGSLARDLYLIQLPSQRGKVFQSWGRDYYYSKQSSNNNR